MAARFVRIDPSLLEQQESHQLFQDVADHYWGCEEDPEAPHSARVVSRLWIFLAEIGSGGINDFLWNHCFNLKGLQQTLADLQEVEAIELQELLQTGICISVEHGIGEYLNEPGARDWAHRFENQRGLTPEALDETSCRAAYPSGSEILARYIRSNKMEF